MKITLKDKFTLERMVKKIQELGKEEALKSIWDWIKKDHIDFGVFKVLLKLYEEKYESMVDTEEEEW